MSSRRPAEPPKLREPGPAEGAGEAPLRLIDGTKKECKGVLAVLETVLGPMPNGSRVRAWVADVPSRIDVRAWAERRGHRIDSDVREDGHFEMVIVKGGVGRGQP